ncbi:MAG TPA: HAD-IA family hydrolase [Nocardioidaceae bacterium]|nr:HAD-IA family hydrolase [Nocardioidaceae bacterium]
MTGLELRSGDYDAIVLDLDGVITDTAATHEAAWRRLFDSVLAQRPPREGEDHRPFTRADYLAYVDGKARYDGAHDFLVSRGVEIPWGAATDPPQRETVCGLANRKDGYFVRLLATRGPHVFDSTVRLVTDLRRLGLGVAVVSASRHCRTVLAAAGLSALFPVRVDGVDADRLGLPGKPDPAIFLEAARRLNADPRRMILVEDAEAGVTAGARGGFGVVIGVDRFGAGDRLRACGADVVVSDLGEVQLVITEHPTVSDRR